MTLAEVLSAIHVDAQTFRNGTQITDPETAQEAARQAEAFEELVAMARRKGATGYEIERATTGEFIGSSFDTVA